MPDPVMAWMVHLERGGPMLDVRGMLSLDESHVSFVEDETQRRTALPVADIEKVKRLRISNVLVVSWRDRSIDRQTAFYFSRPPRIARLRGGEDRPQGLPTLSDVAGSPRRREKRRNIVYLTQNAAPVRETAKGWQAELRSAMKRSGR